MKSRLLYILLVFCLSFSFLMPVAFAENTINKTIVENSKPLPSTGKVLTTVVYAPTDMEKTFFEKLTPKERKTGDFTWATDYSIHGKIGSYVGWFGIVRKIEEDKDKNITTFIIEMKYQDELTDGHIMTVSIYGGGDFKVVAAGVGLGVKYPNLVKVYGTVTNEVDFLPELKAEYIRQWGWGLFNFMDYGKDKTNPEWKALNKIKNAGQIYKAYPTEQYYVDLLGSK
jgi:hypothetical protein